MLCTFRETLSWLVRWSFSVYSPQPPPHSFSVASVPFGRIKNPGTIDESIIVFSIIPTFSTPAADARFSNAVYSRAVTGRRRMMRSVTLEQSSHLCQLFPPFVSVFAMSREWADCTPGFGESRSGSVWSWQGKCYVQQWGPAPVSRDPHAFLLIFSKDPSVNLEESEHGYLNPIKRWQDGGKNLGSEINN